MNHVSVSAYYFDREIFDKTKIYKTILYSNQMILSISCFDFGRYSKMFSLESVKIHHLKI